jgi:oligopeptide/dipeptide ABC transporter ATP-binding protein
MMAPLLRIRGLHVEFPTSRGLVRAVDGVDLDVAPGECLGVVGESGSGKSVTFLSVLGLVRPPGRVRAEAIEFEGRDLRALSADALRAVRGGEIAITLQDALTALNPAFTIGTQLVETIETHSPSLRGAAAWRHAAEMLALVGIPDAPRRLRANPHEFSGGMRQCAMLAIALACRPKLLIADEPTTALDLTIQGQVLDLIDEMRARTGMSVVLVTHDLGIVAERCDRVAVMYAGQIVEQGPARELVERPAHPYTAGLLRSVPRLSDLHAPLAPIPGTVPDPTARPLACRFLPRCTRAGNDCRQPVPLSSLTAQRAVRCVRALVPA